MYKSGRRVNNSATGSNEVPYTSRKLLDRKSVTIGEEVISRESMFLITSTHIALSYGPMLKPWLIIRKRLERNRQ